jgi:exodeoxyribonuclease-3
VAILSRVGLDDVVAGLADGPGFPHQEARALSATCGGVRVLSVYAPNGRVPDSDHYRYKLRGSRRCGRWYGRAVGRRSCVAT